MATFPTGLYTHTALVDGSNYPKAADINNPAAEVVAIEAALGINPNTIDDTVAPGATPASVAVYLDMLANIVKTQSNAANWYSAAVNFVTGTITFTNKRITKRVASATDDATAVIDSDSYDQYYLTAVANATEITITGTPTTGQTIFIGLKDAGVSKALTWTGITALGCTLPTATTAGKQHIIGLMYIAAAWRAIGVSVEV